jgi:hypothetical protein
MKPHLITRLLAVLLTFTLVTQTFAQNKAPQTGMAPTSKKINTARNAGAVTGEEKGLTPEKYYSDLSLRLSPFFSVKRPKPTPNEKVWGTVGTTVGIACAGVAAVQAMPLITGKKSKDKKP